MRPLLLISCIVLLADNFIGASQHKLSKATLNYGNQGQDEYYVPSYFNAYQAYQPYPLLTQLEADQFEVEEQPPVAAPSSKFPSLVGPSISLNGADRLSKYKPSKSNAKQLSAEFRNLLANIKAMQPVVDQRLDLIGEYIKASSQRAAAERARHIPARDAGQAEYYQSPEEPARDTSGPRQKLLPFQAEGMASPYDEIQEAADANLDKRQEQADDHSAKATKESVREPKARRKLTNGPAMLQNNRNLVLAPKAYHQPLDSVTKKESIWSSVSDVYFVAVVACISSVAIFSVIGAGYCFYKVQQSNKAAQDVEFPAYGVIGPASRHDNNNAKCASPPSDRKLAQSAQMYHYHHQKQQMISNEKNANIPRTTNGSDIESDEENEDGEYTVYECPGLAPTGEMEVKNPLFQDDLTPMSSPSVNGAVNSNNNNSSNSKQDSPKVSADAQSAAKGPAKSETK